MAGVQARAIEAGAPARPRSAFPLYLIALGVTLAGGLLMGVRFLPLAELGEDGFQSQLLRVLVSLQQGTLVEDSSEGMLIYVHALRLLGVVPFLAAETVAGSTAQLALLSAVLLPAVLLCYRASGSVLCFAALLLPLAVSGRGVLVAAGVAYLVLYLQHAGARWWYLWLGALWCMLSSASVLMGVLLLLFAANPARAYGAQRWLGVLVLLAALAISAADKVGGFGAGDSGYEAHGFAADNVVLVAISRSTIVTSVVEGQHARALVYSLGALYLLFKTAGLMLDPRRVHMRRVVLCCLPGILLEGLGMLGLAFPLLWLFVGFDPAAWPRMKGKSA